MQTPGCWPGAISSSDDRTQPAMIASGDLDVLRGGLAAIGDELVLDHLSLIQAAEASPLDRRDVDEHVLIAGGRPDEPVAFRRIEPFDGAFLHRLSPSQSARQVKSE